MTSPRPLIGIASGIDEQTRWYALPSTYVRAIEEAGGRAVILPWTGEPRGWIGLVDGVILPGGRNDIDPTHYGDPDPRADYVCPQRDTFEFGLVREAVKQDRPLLGICRGAQVLNVALGGSLYTDLVTDLPGIEHPRQSTADELQHVAHQVQLEPCSALAALMGVDRTGVNSGHHQAIRGVAAALRVAATSSDGLIEAVEAPGHRFMLGVQWHPEQLRNEDHLSARLFAAFVTAACGGGGLFEGRRGEPGQASVRRNWRGSR